jgi:chitodextrinase
VGPRQRGTPYPDVDADWPSWQENPVPSPAVSIARSLAVVAVAAVVFVAGVSPSRTPAALTAIAPNATSVRFTASGDFSASAAAQSVFAGISAIRPDLHLALGDLSYGVTGEEQAWCDLVTGQVGAGFPFELIAGNHESNGQNGNINDFAACLPNQLPGVVGSYGRQYFVDVPSATPLVRFIQISPAIPFADSTWSYAAGTARYAWTAQAIDSARAAGIPWVVVGMHKPCLSLGEYTCEVGDDLLDLLISKRVDLVLGGHEHLYQRTYQLGLSAGCPDIDPDVVTAACIVDTDALMTRGQGTVFATIGTGGTALRDVHTDDVEVGYFSTWSGLNAQPSYGSLDVRVTATELTAAFSPVAGGTFTDAFTVGAGNSPPANVPPTASFTSSCTLLSCHLDGGASVDEDGTVASYAWAFGDGTSGAGVIADHEYAAGGTYTVTLTVTDDDGGNATSSRALLAVAPPSPVLASDSFTRTTANGWGVADTGGPWTISSTPSRYSVTGGAARVSVAAANGPNAYLTGVASTATSFTSVLATDKPASGSGLYVSYSPRRVVGVGAYVAKVRLTSTGQVYLEPMRVNSAGGGEVSLQPALLLPGLSYAVGDQLFVKVEASGVNPTVLRAKVWKVGTIEPVAWQRSVTDVTAGLQSAGGLAINVYLSGSATNAPIQVTVDDVTARTP